MARIVSCGSPCSCVQTVRVYWVRLFDGFSANVNAGRAAQSQNSLRGAFTYIFSINPAISR